MTEPDLEAAIERLLDSRTGSICPSDVARAEGGDHWRALMEPVRRAARRLHDAGRVEIAQHGERVEDLDSIKGPIRIRRP